MNYNTGILLLVDFDCTLSTTSSFDYYASNYRSEFLEELRAFSKQFHRGEIDLSTLMINRLSLINTSKDSLQAASVDIYRNIVDKVKLEFLINLQKTRPYLQIRIASGGLSDLMKYTSTVSGFPISAVEIGKYDGALSTVVDNGFQISKEEGVRRLLKNYGGLNNVILVGDGYNDYEVYKAQLHKDFTFILYTEYSNELFESRQSLRFDDSADFAANNTRLFKILNELIKEIEDSFEYEQTNN